MKKNIFTKILCCTIATTGMVSAGVIADITLNTSNIVSVYANSGLAVTKISESEAVYYNSGLTPVEQNGKFGFKDASGNVVIACTYDSVRDFSDGLACVTKDGKSGFIDTTGTVVIPIKYYSLGDFHNGYASIMVGAGADMIHDAWWFDNGITLSGANLAIEYNYIDKKGNIVFGTPFSASGGEQPSNDFSDGLVSTNLSYNPGSYFDINGNDTGIYYAWYDEDTYSENYYSEGLQAKALEKGDSPTSPKTSMLGRIGEYISDPVMGYVDKSDKVVISFDYEEAKNFHDGYAPVKKNGKWGYIDKSNNVVVDFQFDTADKLNEGVAFATKGSEHYKITVGSGGSATTTAPTTTTTVGSTGISGTSTPNGYISGNTPINYGTLNFNFTKPSEYKDLGHISESSHTSWGTAEAYSFAIRNGLFVGSDGNFNPDKYLTREEVAYAIYKYFGTLDGDSYGLNRGDHNFQDVDNSPYIDAIEWCYSRGIASGISSTEFRPTSLITMEQLAVMLHNFIDIMNYNWKGIDTSDINEHFAEYGYYNDRNTVSLWAIDGVDLSVVWPYLFTDDNNNFNPKSNITRDEFISSAIVMLYPVS